MISPLWSITLTAVGVIGLFFTMRKSIIGPCTGLVVQVVWIAYAVATDQFPFIVSALAYGSVNTYGLLRWRRETANISHTPGADGKHGVVSGGHDDATKREAPGARQPGMDGR